MLFEFFIPGNAKTTRLIQDLVASSAFPKLTIDTIIASRESSTMEAYSRAIKKWHEWRQRPPSSPASTEEVLNYLTELLDSTSSAATVQAAASALAWFFKLSPSPNPCDSYWIKTFLEGVRRSKPDRYTGRRSEGATVLALVGLLYAACLRPSEGVLLLRTAVSVVPGGLLISVAKDKTNKKGPPRQIPIQGRDEEGCPVRILKDWLQKAPRSRYVFPNFLKNPMTYDSARREWRILISKLGLPDNVTLHGFQESAATDAIKDGAPLDEVMRFGRWKQPKTLEAYIEVSPATTPTASSLSNRLPCPQKKEEVHET
ncbi:hypothetical protein L596_000326 [Steinernema carpocapsae]|uniref:Tyr recombinase domain-containing protein n=1 Tax=Steinernema carpocapsae TaxID=34508 RepID=A0A4U8UIF8_STECR|nr:hypothetical protein L596_000326 [Steinernema carpocapsae]